MAWLWSFSLALNLMFAPLALANEILFEKKTMFLGDKKITVEIAETQEQQMRGLMFRKSLPKDQGMLFVYNDEKPRSFWMKNTFIDLDIGFFDASKKLVEIQQMKAVGSVMELPQSYVSKRPATYALEMPQGWFQKNLIKVGETFRLE